MNLFVKKYELFGISYRAGELGVKDVHIAE